MSEWIILYRKSNNRIGFICEGGESEDDSIGIFDTEEHAKRFVDGNRFLETRPWQILEVTEL
jgi:hypothetical protein